MSARSEASRSEYLPAVWCQSLKSKIVNLAATSTLGQSVRLDDLAGLPNLNYNPSRYFCAYFKDKTMEAKVSIFASGKTIAVRQRVRRPRQAPLKELELFT